MYRTVIEIRQDVPEEKLGQLIKTAEREFHNREGRVDNVSKSSRLIVFEGEEKEFGCLNLGILSLYDDKDFLSCVQAWNWIDEKEPDENCDVLKEMSIPVQR